MNDWREHVADGLDALVAEHALTLARLSVSHAIAEHEREDRLAHDLRVAAASLRSHASDMAQRSRAIRAEALRRPDDDGRPLLAVAVTTRSVRPLPMEVE